MMHSAGDVIVRSVSPAERGMAIAIIPVAAGVPTSRIERIRGTRFLQKPDSPDLSGSPAFSAGFQPADFLPSVGPSRAERGIAGHFRCYPQPRFFGSDRI